MTKPLPDISPKPKVLVIVGQTSTGKSDLAVELAKKFDGEVISADSRQVYKGLNISTGKITIAEMRGITHHLIDIIEPNKVFNMASWKDLATKAIEEILNRNKLPIIVGGTGFFIKSLIDNLDLPAVSANQELRLELADKTTSELLEILKNIDPNKAAYIDIKNPVRLIRAIEIATALGYVPETKPQPSPYEFLQIGLSLEPNELKERISKRTKLRLDAGLVNEIKQVHDANIPWQRLEELGFDQKYAAQFLQGKILEKEMVQKITTGNLRYAKRQETWFKRDSRITWFHPINELEQIMNLAIRFLA